VTLPGFEKVFLVLPKMRRFSWNLVQMRRFHHIVTSFFWVQLGTKQIFKTWTGSGFWVPGFSISAWNDPQLGVGESELLIVQYRYLKSCSGDFYSPESDPPHRIMRYLFYYSIWLGFSFQFDRICLSDRICQLEMICTGGVPVSQRYFCQSVP